MTTPPTVVTQQCVFSPPAPLDFKTPSTWEKWIQRFDRYRDVSGLSDLPEEKQVNTLIYCLGEQAEDVFHASSLPVADKKKYDKVKKMFSDFFIGKRNITYERARFNSRFQQEGESVDAFVTELRKLGEHCNFGTLLDDFIKDRIVVGIRDQVLSETLQLDPDLTLDKAIQKCRQKETVRRQQVEMQNMGAIPKSTIDRVQRNKYECNRPERVQYDKPDTTITTCYNCGMAKHPKAQCPAKNATAVIK